MVIFSHHTVADFPFAIQCVLQTLPALVIILLVVIAFSCRRLAQFQAQTTLFPTYFQQHCRLSMPGRMYTFQHPFWEQILAMSLWRVHHAPIFVIL